MRIGLLLVLLASIGVYAEDENPLALREGSWFTWSAKTVIGAGDDRVVTFAKNGDEWQITYEILHYTGRGNEPKRTTEGPFKVTSEDGVLTVHRPDKAIRSTYKFENGKLVLPAFISTRPGEWRYESDWHTLRAVCKNDPAKIPCGEADISGVLGGAGFYVYEESLVVNPEAPVRFLRFMELMKSGALVQRFRLVFDEYGSPRYDEAFNAAQRESGEFQIQIMQPYNPKK